MTRYKLQFREKGQKKFYNFGPTIHRTSAPRYSKIKTMSQAKSVLKETKRIQPNRFWRIRRK